VFVNRVLRRIFGPRVKVTGSWKKLRNESGRVKGRDHSEDLLLDGRIIITLILRKYGGRVWTEFMWLRIGTSGGFW
jgi:hypothetical protein